MALIKFIKASEPPVTWLADALYFIKNNGYAETWVTSAGGTPEEVGNSQMIAAVAGSLRFTALALMIIPAMLTAQWICSCMILLLPMQQIFTLRVKHSVHQTGSV
jgi:hypothetical protein